MLQTASMPLAAGLPGAPPPGPPHVVLIDDDAASRTRLARGLRGSGYRVTVVSGRAQLTEFGCAENPADLVLLRAGPIEQGLTACRTIRTTCAAPLIVLGQRRAECDCIAALDAGADDFLAWPFGSGELLARIRAVLRRAGVRPHACLADPRPWLTFAGWKYHALRHELIAPDGAPVALTAAEHQLLQVFLRAPHRTLGRERLLELTCQRLASASDRSIDVLVSRLRRKMTAAGGGAGELIRTVRGVGYRLAADVEAG